MGTSPVKTMKKQHAGITSVFGCVGLTVTLSGLIMLIVGASWSEEDHWDHVAATVLSSTSTACTAQCNCARVCTGAQTLYSQYSCRSELRCEQCAGSKSTYVMRVEGEAAECPAEMSSPDRDASHPHVRHMPVCEVSPNATFANGATMWGWVQRDCHDGKRLFRLPEAFPYGAPKNQRVDPDYLIETGAIVLGVGAFCVLIAGVFWCYSKPSFDAAKAAVEEQVPKMGGNDVCCPSGAAGGQTGADDHDRLV